MIVKAIKNKNMQKVNQGHHLYSFDTVLPQVKIGQIIRVKRGLIVAIVGAFFITSVLITAMNSIYYAFNPASTASGIDEMVAYIPGSFVSNNIAQGYLGK